MKKLLYILFAVTLFTACSSDDDNDTHSETNKNIQFKIINSTSNDFDAVAASVYKYKNSNDDEDFIIISGGIKSGMESAIYRTSNKYINILYQYQKDLGEGMKPETVSKFYPTKSTLHELKEGEVNIIEIE